VSLLRDGIHRRAPLTARAGSARAGAARCGCVYGQDDLDGLTREIKGSGLIGVGPFYIWAEVLPNASPFSGGSQYYSTGVCAFHIGDLTSTVSYGFSANLLLGCLSTDYNNPAMLANLLLGCEDDGSFVAGTVPGSNSPSDVGAFGPNPLAGPTRVMRKG